MKKRFGKVLAIISILIVIMAGLYLYAVYVPVPEVDSALEEEIVVSKRDSGFYRYGNSWLRKSRSGLFEMYVEGNPYKMGLINGKLSRQLVYNQEKHFVDKLQEMVPSQTYISFLKYFVAWFNKDLDENISDEYLKEIYGVSRSASEEYSFIGPPFYRILNYHAAHDIGHFLQELHMVGCTSFASWDVEKTDSSMIVGRNFDFYVGDKFAEEKIIAFMNPDSGYKFMSVTWGGMIGVVSGMNESGLTVTINAAQGPVPFKTATPISLVAREILQYASTIEEARKIVASRQTFVGQSFLVASAIDNKAAVIEKTTETTAVYFSGSDEVFCSNHFQSEELKNSETNLTHQIESSTAFRYDRIKYLVDSLEVLNENTVAGVLRDTRGPKGKSIGLGNERALNQLQGHHSIIFKPKELLVWVSTAPWQEGPYICYDLKRVFNEFVGLDENREIYVDTLSIATDTLLNSREFENYLHFRKARPEVQKLIADENKNDQLIYDFIGSNPDYYQVYSLAGEYFESTDRPDSARKYYQLALEKSIPWKSDSLAIQEKLLNITEEEN